MVRESSLEIVDPVALALPFRGTWRVEKSPAHRVPSHGTHLFATTYAIDFVAVRDGRPAVVRDWRTVLATEPNERFHGFGEPVLAPATGTVVAVHDGEPDHEARRSQLALLSYALTQASRVRGGAGAIAGNHVVLELAGGGPYVVLAHLRLGSLLMRPGDPVGEGDQLAQCGNSGNSTQPHLHIQVMDSVDAFTARGLPMAFGPYRARSRSDREPRHVPMGMPENSEVVEPV